MRFISRRNPISVNALKRKPTGSVIRHHSEWEDTEFVRVVGGWLRSRTDFTGLRPVVVSSATVADECNRAIGCRQSWAEVY